jgi:hypothetical protein
MTLQALDSSACYGLARLSNKMLTTIARLPNVVGYLRWLASGRSAAVTSCAHAPSCALHPAAPAHTTAQQQPRVPYQYPDSGPFEEPAAAHGAQHNSQLPQRQPKRTISTTRFQPGVQRALHDKPVPAGMHRLLQLSLQPRCNHLA